jgi:beta-lactamase superfamily II metal-dependent hydrolase
MSDDFRFAGYPAATVYASPDGKQPIQQLLWGDYVRLTGPRQGDWFPVRARNAVGWIQADSLQADRVLEIIFVDIGQGDGSLIITPDDRHFLVDAGAGDNLVRFLRWRYNRFRKPRHFESVVISHPDADHYNGFRDIFDESNVTFGTVFHNGLVERAGADPLGNREDVGGVSCLTEVVPDRAALETLFAGPANWQSKTYPKMLKKALDSGRVQDIRMLCSSDCHMPGYGPDQELSIEVLGPVPEPDPEHPHRLRWFGDLGKTKNGHSVVLRLRYRNITVLLGGDLNIPAEYHLLSQYTGQPIPPTTAEEERLVVEAARKFFQCDVAKACHHGSADFSDLFLQALNPIATVISSGDAEPYAHPRADTLGTIGRFSRGARPLIFSTELARSAPETIKHPAILREKFREALQKIEQADTPEAKAKAHEKHEALLLELERSVAVFGAINLRTDGHRIVMGYKIEKPRSKDKEWDLYLLEPTPAGVLRYVSKFEEGET